MTKKLNAYTDDEKWRSKISAYLSTNLVLSGADQVLAFDTVKWSRDLSVTAGVFTINTIGYYSGTIHLSVDVTGVSSFIIWIECKPFATGIWELCGESMLKIAGGDDFSGDVPLNSGFDFLIGDEVRVMIKKVAGTVSLLSASEIVGLGTVTQPSASITFTRSDNIL